jgi:hypothetical protein
MDEVYNWKVKVNDNPKRVQESYKYCIFAFMRDIFMLLQVVQGRFMLTM